MSHQDTDFEFEVMPSYNAGKLKLKRTNAPFPEMVIEPPPANAEVSKFLAQRGWMGTTTGWVRDTDTHSGYTWEQAIAIEFMNFITLGGPTR